ncbi:SH3 domain-containing protein, partial [Alkalihalophilus pseudofirmus]
CQAFLPQGKTLAANTGGSVMIATDAVNIRSGPDLIYPLIAIAKRGETYQVVQEQGDWVEVRLSVSKTGWQVNWLVTTESE